MSSELPEKRTLKPLLKKIILWSVIAGGVIALFVPVFVKSTPVLGSVPGATLPVAAQADEDPCALFGEERCIGEGNVREALDSDDAGRGIVKIIFQVINFLILIAAAVAVVFVIAGGYFILTSSGSQSQEKQGKDMLKNALIGLVIILLSAAVVQLIAQIITGFQ